MLIDSLGISRNMVDIKSILYEDFSHLFLNGARRGGDCNLVFLIICMMSETHDTLSLCIYRRFTCTVTRWKHWPAGQWIVRSLLRKPSSFEPGSMHREDVLLPRLPISFRCVLDAYVLNWNVAFVSYIDYSCLVWFGRIVWTHASRSIRGGLHAGWNLVHAQSSSAIECLLSGWKLSGRCTQSDV